MKIYKYSATLLSDIIITSNASTEGYSESLDYIPGSKFLGIVAGKLYDEQNINQTLDLFHNGVVKYSDANLTSNGDDLRKIPFSWYHEKGKKIEDQLFIHHHIQSAETQLKQARNGYFSPTNNYIISLEQQFSLKSAHDFETRKSSEGQMFGYFSLKKGSIWTFYISDDKGIYVDEIKKVLVGKHRIGRSRSAEFGMVDIEFISEVYPSNDNILLSDEIVIYAESNLCFYNESTGQTTSQPKPEYLVGTSNASIIWEKCQVRTRNYKTWNRYRNNKDSERIIVERGSVFVVKLDVSISNNFFLDGVGSHKNEGFGKVMVNPVFLSINQPGLSKGEFTYVKKYNMGFADHDAEIIQSLIKRKERRDVNYSIDKHVNEFIESNAKKFKRISNSQWGILRNIGKNSKGIDDFNLLVFDDNVGFINKGISANAWVGCKKILKNKLDIIEQGNPTLFLPFVIKLSTQMAKRN